MTTIERPARDALPAEPSRASWRGRASGQRRFGPLSRSSPPPPLAAADSGQAGTVNSQLGTGGPRLAVVTAGPPPYCLPDYSPVEPGQTPDAVLVIAADGHAHPELWPAAGPPILVVLPSGARHLSVLAAFAAGADGCVRTDCAAIVAAHLTALLRRTGATLPELSEQPGPWGSWPARALSPARSSTSSTDALPCPTLPQDP
jgi:hypothetical protein